MQREPRQGETPALIPERLGVADTPQETIRELKDLVIAYAKQETVDPLKGLARYVAYGVAGAALLGLGIMFLAIGLLRILQGESDNPHFTGNWSWVPYAIVVVIVLAVAALSWYVATKKRNVS